MKKKMYIAVLMTILVLTGCAARQNEIYRITMMRKIQKNLVGPACTPGRGYRLLVKVDSNWAVTNIVSRGSPSEHNCAERIAKAIYASSPFQEPPPEIREKAINKGFLIKF